MDEIRLGEDRVRKKKKAKKVVAPDSYVIKTLRGEVVGEYGNWYEAQNAMLKRAGQCYIAGKFNPKGGDNNGEA